MQIQENIPLSMYTNFRVGGPADFFIEAKTQGEIREAFVFAQTKHTLVYVLGGGTNVLVSDAGSRGLVIKLSSSELKVDGECIVADAGCTMGQVVAVAQKNGLTGLEWAVGLPGTVGGAVFGNAGCFGGETAQVIENCTVFNYLGISNFQFPISPDASFFDVKEVGIPTLRRNKQDLSNNFKIKTVDKNYLSFAYRYSVLKETGEAVLTATFRLKRGSSGEIAAGMERIRQKSKERIQEQPLGAWTAGSTFKGVRLTPDLTLQLRSGQGLQITDHGLDLEKGLNRAGYISAGFLLEQTGLKGFRIGDASFSSHHANFIINHGRATATDIVKLIEMAKAKIKEKFGIALEEEIRYIGE